MKILKNEPRSWNVNFRTTTCGWESPDNLDCRNHLWSSTTIDLVYIIVCCKTRARGLRVMLSKGGHDSGLRVMLSRGGHNSGLVRLRSNHFQTGDVSKPKILSQNQKWMGWTDYFGNPKFGSKRFGFGDPDSFGCLMRFLDLSMKIMFLLGLFFKVWRRCEEEKK